MKPWPKHYLAGEGEYCVESLLNFAHDTDPNHKISRTIVLEKREEWRLIWNAKHPNEQVDSITR